MKDYCKAATLSSGDVKGLNAGGAGGHGIDDTKAVDAPGNPDG